MCGREVRFHSHLAILAPDEVGSRPARQVPSVRALRIPVSLKLTSHVRYRRDAGDTLIKAYVCTRELFAADNTYRNPRYYILKDDMLAYYVNDILQRLSARQEHDGWEVRSCLCWSYGWS